MVDEQVLIVNELRGSVLKCARDQVCCSSGLTVYRKVASDKRVSFQNANHVLQRILERVPADRVRFIAEACEGQVHSLATHPYGKMIIFLAAYLSVLSSQRRPRLPSLATHLGEHERRQAFD